MRLALLLTTLLLAVLPKVRAEKPDASPAQAEVEKLLDRATHSLGPEQTELLLQADDVARRMERDQEGSCCGLRCVRIHDYSLSFRWIEIQGKEAYQHDLLEWVVSRHSGEAVGARALAAYLSYQGCELDFSKWMPEFEAVLAIVNRPEWRNLDEPKLLRVRAEAYETWWSLSKASSSDPAMQDNGLRAADFQPGAEKARRSAVRAYRRLALQFPEDEELRGRLKKLMARQDTEQRNWFCFGD